VDIEKKTVVEVLPNTLIIRLQRIIFDMDTFMNRKLNTRVELPQVLNMRGYMKDEVLKAEKERIDRAKRAQRQQQRQEAEQRVPAR
jgi:2-oxo-4-hydroxy-4-carboxy--5-ureidoimidazoline (OHCU) decarboxylase